MSKDDIPETGDNFDRLLAHRAEIADFVNSFESERVQRSAFDAIVCSLGLADDAAPVASPVERLHIVDQPSAAEQDPMEDGVTDTEFAGGPRRRRTRNGSKKNFTVTRGLNFAPEGHPPFDAFVAEKSPKNHDEKCLVACYYLTEMMGISEVGIGHVLAAYQAAEWSTPAHPDATLRSAASRTGWLDTADTKAIKVVWKGENYLKTKMPTELKKKSS